MCFKISILRINTYTAVSLSYLSIWLWHEKKIIFYLVYFSSHLMTHLELIYFQWKHDAYTFGCPFSFSTQLSRFYVNLNFYILNFFTQYVDKNLLYLIYEKLVSNISFSTHKIYLWNYTSYNFLLLRNSYTKTSNYV